MDKNPKSNSILPNKSKKPIPALNKEQLSAAKSSPIEDIAMFIKQLSLTYSKFALYPSDHPVTQNQIKTTWNELLLAFEKYGNIDITFTEGTPLFCGMPVEKKNITVNKLAQHFESINIKSVEFLKKLDFEEFARFITIFSQDAKVINELGEANLLLKQNEINNITFHAAVYQVVRDDQQTRNYSNFFQRRKDQKNIGEIYGIRRIPAGNP